MNRVADASVSELGAQEVPFAAAILGRAYRDNPLSVALLGEDPDLRVRVNEALMAVRLSAMQRRPLGVHAGGRLTGICGFEGPEGLNMTPEQRQGMARALEQAGPDALPKLGEMLSEFAKRAPDGRYWKLGPVAVNPDWQGGGLGTAMVRGFCERMDELGEVACLDTDQVRNVRLYERFGFEVTDEGLVLGVQMWFMTRRPR